MSSHGYPMNSMQHPYDAERAAREQSLAHPADAQREHGQWVDSHPAEIQRALAACPVCDGTGSTRDTYYSSCGREYGPAVPCGWCKP